MRGCRTPQARNHRCERVESRIGCAGLFVSRGLPDECVQTHEVIGSLPAKERSDSRRARSLEIPAVAGAAFTSSMTPFGTGLGEPSLPKRVIEQRFRRGRRKRWAEAGMMRPEGRTSAGRAGFVTLTARAVSPVGWRPSSHLAARDSPRSGCTFGARCLRTFAPRFGRAAARRGLDARPLRGESRAPSGLRRAGLRPRSTTGAGAPEIAGAISRCRPPRPSARPAGAGAASGAAAWTALPRHPSAAAPQSGA